MKLPTDIPEAPAVKTSSLLSPEGFGFVTGLISADDYLGSSKPPAAEPIEKRPTGHRQTLEKTFMTAGGLTYVGIAGIAISQGLTDPALIALGAGAVALVIAGRPNRRKP